MKCDTADWKDVSEEHTASISIIWEWANEEQIRWLPIPEENILRSQACEIFLQISNILLPEKIGDLNFVAF
jgi:hypothetical protein